MINAPVLPIDESSWLLQHTATQSTRRYSWAPCCTKEMRPLRLLSPLPFLATGSTRICMQKKFGSQCAVGVLQFSVILSARLLYLSICEADGNSLYQDFRSSELVSFGNPYNPSSEPAVVRQSLPHLNQKTQEKPPPPKEKTTIWGFIHS